MSKFIKLTDHNGDILVIDKNVISHIRKHKQESWEMKSFEKCKSVVHLKRQKNARIYVQNSADDIYDMLKEYYDETNR